MRTLPTAPTADTCKKQIAPRAMAALPAAVLHDRQHIREATYCFQIPPTYIIIAYNVRCTIGLTSYWAARHPSSTATTTITAPALTAARLSVASNVSFPLQDVSFHYLSFDVLESPYMS